MPVLSCAGRHNHYTINTMKKKKTFIDPDADLIEQAAGGDERAFEQLVKKYQSMVFSTVYRYIGNPDDVEDCALLCTFCEEASCDIGIVPTEISFNEAPGF